MTATQRLIRQRISEILVKHDMPTRQVAISDLVSLVEEIETQATQHAVITTLKGLLDPDYKDEFLYRSIQDQLRLYIENLSHD